MSEAILQVDHLTKHFPVRLPMLQRLVTTRPPLVHAVDDVSFAIDRGEIFGLVGESGCGKTTVGRTVVRLLKPTSGRILFEGKDITNLPSLEEHFVYDFLARQMSRLKASRSERDSEVLRSLRRRMQIIFQDPHAALNPAMTIGESIMDPLLIHDISTPSEARDAVLSIMTEVGLAPAESLFGKYPAELSGGQKQRAVIARALILRPSLIVADEPVAMLDMSVRARILELMLDLQRRHGLTYLFITHDLATAKLLCDRIGIMYLGNLVEEGDAARVYANPKHPYTQALLDAVPIPDPDRRRTKALPRGEVPDALNPPGGCRFHPRCPVARADCGWDAADFVDFLERRRLDPNTAQMDEAQLGPISGMKIQDHVLRIPAPRGEAARVRGYVRGVLANLRDPMVEAITGVESDTEEIRVTWRPSEDIAFRTVEGGRVACVLY